MTGNEGGKRGKGRGMVFYSVWLYVKTGGIHVSYIQIISPTYHIIPATPIFTTFAR